MHCPFCESPKTSGRVCDRFRCGAVFLYTVSAHCKSCSLRLESDLSFSFDKTEPGPVSERCEACESLEEEYVTDVWKRIAWAKTTIRRCLSKKLEEKLLSAAAEESPVLSYKDPLGILSGEPLYQFPKISPDPSQQRIEKILRPILKRQEAFFRTAFGSEESDTGSLSLEVKAKEAQKLLPGQTTSDATISGSDSAEKDLTTQETPQSSSSDQASHVHASQDHPPESNPLPNFTAKFTRKDREF